jgi:hypothetical protein
MKSNVVIPVVAVGLIVAGAWVFLQPKGNPASNLPSASAEQPREARTVATGATDAQDKVNPPGTVTEKTFAGTNGATAVETTHEEYVAARVAELGEFAMSDDATSLDTILSELTNRDPEIRKAAREAAVQFGSRDAIPKLADVALQTDDAHEKAALTDAIEFLKLPTLTEFQAQARADGTAATQPAGAKTIRRKPPAQTAAPPAPQ